MDVAMLWIKRKNEDTPELLTAWDGYCIEANWEGWEEDCRKSLEAVGSDVEAKRFLNVHIDDNKLLEFFREWQTIPAERITQLDDPSALA